MFLATREITHSKFRYVLIVAIMTLIAWLVFLLTGLASGLSSDNAGALVNMEADYLLFEEDSGYSPRRSLLEMAMVSEVAAISGVDRAAPLGLSSLSISSNDDTEMIDVTIFGIAPDSFLLPEIVEGDPLPAAPGNQVVVDRSLHEDYGIDIGDELRGRGYFMQVVGFVENRKYSHMPVVYADIPFWQNFAFPTDNFREGRQNPINAIAIQMEDDAVDRLTGAFEGVELATHDEAVSAVPGYSEELGTITMIQVFLFLIAALIMTVFFYVITMQKTAQFGILKAVGASTVYLARSLLMQVIVMAIVGIMVGALLSYTIAAVLPTDVPFTLELSRVLIYGVVLLIVALVGTLLSLRQISQIDPLIAIGRAE